MADSVSIFAEGTFSEQIKELVTYIARSKPEADRPSFTAPFQESLTVKEGDKSLEDDESKRKNIIAQVFGAITGSEDGSAREIEGFYNLIFAHFLSLYDVESTEARSILDPLLKTISSSSMESTVKYRVLSNLFNSTPRKSSIRLSIYTVLLTLAETSDELEVLALTPEDVDKWLDEWPNSNDEKSAFLKHLETAYLKADEAATAYKFTLTYARLVDPTSSHAQAAAVHVIASALQLPSLFDFDPLLKLELVSNIQKHPIYALLQIFLQNGLAEYQSWVSQNGAVISEHSLNTTELERKIRLLSMASLAFENVGKDLPYTTIASSLQIDDDAVERWSIDAIRAGLVGGRLSQTQRTFHISRATPRNFGSAQWGVLEQRLLAWQTGLAGVMDVLIAAQKAGGRPAAVVDTTSSS